MKVSLIATHQLTMEDEVHLSRCLGVLALAASLSSNDIECNIIDLREFHNPLRFDYEVLASEVVKRITESNADILGFSTMSNNLPIAIDIAQRIKREQPKTHIVFGGPGVSFQASLTIKAFPQINAILRGEADFTFVNYVRALRNKETHPSIPGLVYYSENTVVDHDWPEPIPDLDILPIPMYSLCEMSEDTKGPVYLEIGRGCPYSCTFCSTSAFFRRKFRMKSVKRVVEEVKHIQETLKVSTINFTHDLLTYDKQYILELCDKLEELPEKITWGASARLDTLDEKIVQRMRAAGCRGLFIGIEVGTKRMQELVGKKLDLNKLLDVVRMIVSYELPCTLSFIVGFPSEDKTDIEALFSILFKVKALSFWKIHTQVHALTPEPGSKLLIDHSDELKLDEHGSPGTTSIPSHWFELRKLVQDNPHIFPSYFHFNSALPRYHTLMYTFLGELIEGPSNLSLRLAYSYLGKELPKHLIDDVTELGVEVPHKFDINRSHLMQEVKHLVSGYLEGSLRKLRCYESIANYEIAINQILHKPNGLKNPTIVVWFDPIDIIKELERGNPTPEEICEEHHRVLIVFWDEESESVKYTELPKTLLKFIEEFEN